MCVCFQVYVFCYSSLLLIRLMFYAIILLFNQRNNVIIILSPFLCHSEISTEIDFSLFFIIFLIRQVSVCHLITEKLRMDITLTFYLYYYTLWLKLYCFFRCLLYEVVYFIKLERNKIEQVG